VRKAWLAPVLLAAALVLQLTVLNRLHLPGGGVPDLMLVLVASLAMAEGPVPGMVTGFAVGLCLDLAPPGSQLIGQYALVFCLAGWAAGRLSRAADRSPLRALGLVACVVVAAEALVAGLGLVLEPAQVTSADVRQVLPATIGYDLLLCPFVLYLVMIALARNAGRLGASSMSALLAAPARSPGIGASRAGNSRAGNRKHRPAEPQLGRAAARIGDGWVGGGPGRQSGAGLKHGAGRKHGIRLHPGDGVAGSASGLVRHRGRPVAPVNLRLTTPRRGDAAIGNAVGGGPAQYRPGRHPGLLAGTSRQFRPHGGELGGSAARQHGLTRLGQGKAPDRAKISFSAHRGDGSVGRTLGTSWLRSTDRGSGRGPRLRVGASRSALQSRSTSAAPAVPSIRFRAGPAPVVRRPAAAPRFRHRSAWLGRSALSTGLVAGGVLDQSTFRAARRTTMGVPRLRLAGRGAGMLGGSGRSLLRRPPARPGKKPRFGYGRRSMLSYLTGRHIGGRWLASKRVGSRSGVWLIGRRTGGVK